MLEESDLGVTVRSDLKQTDHWRSASMNANNMLGPIARDVECKAAGVMFPLYYLRLNHRLAHASSAAPLRAAPGLAERPSSYSKLHIDAKRKR